MALSEFQLITRYFEQSATEQSAPGVVLGIGDDAAVLAPPPNTELAVAVDTLVSGVHFPEDCDPYAVGWRSLAVNLSDLAAMGADPLWFTLALTLPESDESWLEQFSRGLFDLAGRSGITLVGGDTTRGPLTVSIQVHGSVPVGKALRRDGASVGDAVYVTGYTGEAAAALAVIQQRESEPCDFLDRFYQPTPRNSLGVHLRDIASAGIDISDGLLADLTHILERSNVGACLDASSIPYSSRVEALFDKEQAVCWALSGGDDYELCFCAPAGSEAVITELAKKHQTPVHRIGEIVSVGDSQPRLCLLDEQGGALKIDELGYTHF